MGRLLSFSTVASFAQCVPRLLEGQGA